MNSGAGNNAALTLIRGASSGDKITKGRRGRRTEGGGEGEGGREKEGRAFSSGGAELTQKGKLKALDVLHRREGEEGEGRSLRG